MRFVGPRTNYSEPSLTSTLVLGGVVGQVVAAVVGDAHQVPGHRAGHHQQPRPGHWARERHVGPTQSINDFDLYTINNAGICTLDK